MEVGDSLTVIAYHPSSSDPFYNYDAVGRANYYSVQYVPTMWFDGVGSVIGGNYTQYRNWFNSRKNVAPEVEINVYGDYNQNTGQGWATAAIKNVTSNTINGICHFAICQTDTPYYWQGYDSLHYIERKMCPNYNGTSVTIDPGETEEVTQSFTVQPSWERDDCYLSVFFQKSNGTITQAAEVDLLNLGVEEGDIEAVQSFTICPNPVREYLMISLNCKNAQVEIIDCAGGVRKTAIVESHNLRIPINELSPGIYFCRVKTEGRAETRKFIKY